MTYENEEYTITDYVSQHFSIKIGETLTFLSMRELQKMFGNIYLGEKNNIY